MSPDESSLLAPAPSPDSGDMARYQRIFEHAGIGVTRVATDGVILECNDAFAHILGATPAEVVGLNVWSITHPDDRERDMAESTRVIRGEIDGYTIEKRYVRPRDGQAVWVHLTATVVREADGRIPYGIGVVQDVTARRVAAERARCLLALGTALAASDSPEAAMGATVGTAVTTMGASSAAFFLVEDDLVRVTDVRGFAEARTAQHERFPLALETPVTTAIRTQAPVVVRSPADLAARFPHLADEYAAQHVAAAILVPLLASGRALGAFGVGFATAHDVATDEVEFVEAVASQAGQAIERARLLAAERAARAEAEAASRAKSDFLAIMSHELRTPLNAILGYQDLLDVGVAGPLTPTQRDYVERVRASARHLLSLINRVLSFSRLDAGAVEYDLAPVPVARLLHLAEPLVTPQVREKGVAFAIDVGPPGLIVIADAEKATQVLLNLVGNAVKFTSPGGAIHLAASPWEGPRGPFVAIRVTDTGEGIPPDMLETIFEPFRQVDAHFARRTAGTGLGLAIARSLARGMGGELTVESTLGEGSTFTLVLPGA